MTNKDIGSKKPQPLLAQPIPKVCAYCGKPSYSQFGVHPQCEVSHADAIARESRRERNPEKAAPPAAKAPLNWRQKKCPKCHAPVHVRQHQCQCGHRFV